VLNTALYATLSNAMALSHSLDFSRLSAAYEAGLLTPGDVVRDVLAEIEASRPANPVWIHVIAREVLLERAAALAARHAHGDRPPLYGVPFAVKDNIDVAGEPTTAACPAFSYVASETAFAVRRLEEAGAICIGKTNMDQFATGLVGTRSPYGVCRNPFDARYISGGSSAGSALSVALGHVSFALGTDTAGSGRVPAGFCNVVGWKPTRGVVSTGGVVPACRSLDCVSVFALTTNDAGRVAEVLTAYDASDPFSREAVAPRTPGLSSAPRWGVLRASDLKFFGDDGAEAAYAHALQTLSGLGAELVEIDYPPFAETARLLYEGPWVAERLAAIKPFFTSSAESLDPIVRKIVASGEGFSAVDAFEAQYRLQALKQRCAEEWQHLDLLVVPTAGALYRIDEIVADQLQLNTNLGYYTNFVNLLDLAAVAVPSHFRSDGLPFGLTFIGRAFDDTKLLHAAGRFHHAAGTALGATRFALPPADDKSVTAFEDDVKLAVVGAHLSGMPLNHQLVSRGARLIAVRATAPHYRLFELTSSVPPKPGLSRVANGSGAAIIVELWSISAAAFGAFVAEIPPPLAIGTLTLDDGTKVKGFVCEGHALEGARDITAFGGWRNFMIAEGMAT